MKIKSLLVASVLAADLTANAGPLIGNLMSGSTNIVAANGSTWQVGTIAAGTVAAPATNAFNLNIGSTTGTGWGYNETTSNAVISQSSTSANGFIINGGQVNTNLLPVYAVNTYPGYPGTLYGPMSTIGVEAQVNLQNTNAESGIYVFYYATSADGTNANQGVFTQTVTVPGGSKIGSCFSNYVLQAANYLLLQGESSTNAQPGTNELLEATGKAGF